MWKREKALLGWGGGPPTALVTSASDSDSDSARLAAVSLNSEYLLKLLSNVKCLSFKLYRVFFSNWILNLHQIWKFYYIFRTSNYG